MSDNKKKPNIDFSKLVGNNTLSAAEAAEALVTGKAPGEADGQLKNEEKSEKKNAASGTVEYESFFRTLDEFKKTDQRLNVGVYKSILDVIDSVASAEKTSNYMLVNVILLSWIEENKANIKTSINKKNKSLLL